MKLLEDVIIKDSIEIDATPEKAYEFFMNLRDDESYKAWHPEDHVAFQWIKGNPWEEGSVVNADEYIHGKLHKLKFIVTKLVPNKEIEYVPVSRVLRFYMPMNRFEIEPTEKGCVFTAEGHLRVGKLAKIFAKKKLEEGLAAVRKHMKEEGENLKRILETGSVSGLME